MGPGGTEGAASTHSPPKFDDDSDRVEWKESVHDWSENRLACAEGGDKKSKGNETRMGLKLYLSIYIATKEKVKKSIRSSEIILKPT